MFLFDMIKSWLITIGIILGVAYASGVQMPILDEYIARLKATIEVIYQNADQTFHDNFKNEIDKVEELKKHIPTTPAPNESQ